MPFDQHHVNTALGEVECQRHANRPRPDDQHIEYRFSHFQRQLSMFMEYPFKTSLIKDLQSALFKRTKIISAFLKSALWRIMYPKFLVTDCPT